MSEKVKKPFYKKWWVWLIAIILVIAIFSGGEDEEAEIVSSDGESNSEESNQEEQKVEKEEKTEFNIGEKVELKNNVVEVVEVEKSSGDEFDKPKEGKEYVIIHVAIENDGDKEITYNPYDFKMKNSNGQIEDPTFTIVDSDTSLSSGELSPGGNVSGSIVFEQEIGDEELQLIFEADFWSDKKITFNLQ